MQCCISVHFEILFDAVICNSIAANPSVTPGCYAKRVNIEAHHESNQISQKNVIVK